MKHIKLFESFDFTHSLETLVAQMVKELTPPTTNPKEIDDLISGFEELGINKKPMDLRIDLTDPLIPFLVWHNPEDYDGDFSNVNPLNVLAFVQIGGEYYAYKLTPEEKYYKEIISDEEEGMYDQDQLVKIENVDDLKRAFQESLWDMD
jgi:hypothetical protein